MFYNIERTLEYLPYISLGILGILLIFLEIKNFKEMLIDRPKSEPGRGGFLPPSGEGYEYYVSNSTIVYIFRKAKNRFRVYLIQGNSPNACMKKDKHGTYFTVRCEDTGTAEKVVDNAFSAGAERI